MCDDAYHVAGQFVKPDDVDREQFSYLSRQRRRGSDVMLLFAPAAVPKTGRYANKRLKWTLVPNMVEGCGERQL